MNTKTKPKTITAKPGTNARYQVGQRSAQWHVHRGRGLREAQQIAHIYVYICMCMYVCVCVCVCII